MSWSTTLLLRDGHLTEAPLPLRNMSMPPSPIPAGTPRSLLIQVSGSEWLSQPTAYTRIQACPIWFETPSGEVWMDPGASVTDLTDVEKRLVRTFLIERSLTAWESAEPGLRAFLGDPT